MSLVYVPNADAVNSPAKLAEGVDATRLGVARVRASAARPAARPPFVAEAQAAMTPDTPRAPFVSAFGTACNEAYLSSPLVVTSSLTPKKPIAGHEGYRYI